MFTNVTQVQALTGVEVDRSDIIRAQAVIEGFLGRNETQITDPDDVALVSKAVAFQAVYMKNNYDRVYDQVALVQLTQMDGSMTFNRDLAAPFIAPLAALTLRNVSWKKSRSVKTGPIFTRPMPVRWETN